MGKLKSTIDARYKNPDNDPRGSYRLESVTLPFDRQNLQYEWCGYLPPPGQSWRYSRERAEELAAENRILLSSNGILRLKRYLSEAASNGNVENAVKPLSRLELILRTAMKSIPLEIARNPECLREVEWRDLERAMREIFEQLGFGTKLTRSGKDGGFDLELDFKENGETQIFLVEIKHWLGSGKKPGYRVLSAFVDVVAKTSDKTRGLLLSSSGFTGNVLNGRTEVQQHTVRIAGQNKIVSLCQSYLESLEGIWYPTTELSQMLIEGSS